MVDALAATREGLYKSLQAQQSTNNGLCGSLWLGCWAHERVQGRKNGLGDQQIGDWIMRELHLTHTEKEAIYQEILPQIEHLIADESNLTANLANIAAVLKQAFGWLWVGFYLVDASSSRSELVLGPFQGPLACTRIPHGRGVCGQAWATGQTVVVQDVHQHPDHIACSALSQSEIVVPLFDKKQQCWGVLDADADQIAQFDAVDARYLEQLTEIICARHG